MATMQITIGINSHTTIHGGAHRLSWSLYLGKVNTLHTYTYTRTHTTVSKLWHSAHACIMRGLRLLQHLRLVYASCNKTPVGILQTHSSLYNWAK